MRYSIRSTVTVVRVFEETVEADSPDAAQKRGTTIALNGEPEFVVSQVFKIDTDVVRVEKVAE